MLLTVEVLLMVKAPREYGRNRKRRIKSPTGLSFIPEDPSCRLRVTRALNSGTRMNFHHALLCGSEVCHYLTCELQSTRGCAIHCLVSHPALSIIACKASMFRVRTQKQVEIDYR